MNPQLKPFLETWAEKWSRLNGTGPAARRAHFELIAREMRLPTPGDVDTGDEHWINTPGGAVRIRVFRHDSGGVQPALIYLHGGAFMQGSPETHWDITARLASWCRQTVLSVDYAKSPERPFPAAFDQGVAVAQWAQDQAAMLGIDPYRIAVGGDSAGGNLAAAISVALRGTQAAPLAQLLIYPACDFDASRPSYAENPEGPVVRVADMDAVNAMYCPDPADLRDPRAAPLLADSHAGLPPAYIAVAQYDPLRDSGRAYAAALEAAGVPVTLHEGPGLIHGYLRAMGTCDESEQRLRAMAAWLSERHAEAGKGGQAS